MQIKDGIQALIKISLPIIMGQIGQMLIGAGDVYIATLYSTNSVASIGVANGVFNPLFLFGIGLMMGISPSLAYMRANSEKNSSEHLLSVIIYAFFSGLILTALMLVLNTFVPYFGFPEIMVPSIQNYISIVSWSIPFAIVFQAIKEYLQAYEIVMIPNLLTIIAVVLNLITNYILVFGLGPFQGLGEIGLAWASLIIRFLLFLALFIYVFKKIGSPKLEFKVMKLIFNFSLPIAFMFFLEVLAFCTVTILSGKIGVIAAAANNIIMTLASIAFMIPLSLSSAVAVKLGHALGKKDFQNIRTFVFSVLIINTFFIFISAGSFLLFPDAIMNSITNDKAVIQLGISLLYIVALFQLSDATQAVLTGILRGLKQTKASSLIIFVGYWVLGIPLGYYLAFYKDYSAEGLWIGLAVSLTFCALFLAFITKIQLKKLSTSL